MAGLLDMEIVAAVSPQGARVTVSAARSRVVDCLAPGSREALLAGELLRGDDIPPGQFFWLSGLRRYGAAGSPAEARQAARIIWGLWLALAGGRPILTQCRRGMALHILRSLPRMFSAEVTILRGSLREDNPPSGHGAPAVPCYPPLIWPGPPESDDDHIVQVRS